MKALKKIRIKGIPSVYCKCKKPDKMPNHNSCMYCGFQIRKAKGD